MDELGRQRERGELALAISFTAMTGLGAWLHAPLLTLFGALGAFSSTILYIWQRCCLMRLTYRRDIDEHRVQFGDTIHVAIELVNDKVLPLPWVRVIDQFPPGLFPDLPVSPLPIDVSGLTPIRSAMGTLMTTELTSSQVALLRGEIPTAKDSGYVDYIQSFAMLPFQRSQRQIDVVCGLRGRHRFGNSKITSGDPLGIRPRTLNIEHIHEVIVYPKLMATLVPALFSRTPLGDDRAHRLLLGDPTRVAGMRPYRAGDPLRHIDWRATARRTELLVRDFEPTTTLSLEFFVDCQLPNLPDIQATKSPSEFSISLGASMINWSTGLAIPSGLFAPGLADDAPVGTRPVAGPHATAQLLELLALLTPDSSTDFAQSMLRGATSLGHGTSGVVITSHYGPEVLNAIATCRRRSPITAIYISGLGGDPPPRRLVDESYVVAYSPTWQEDGHVVIG
jgi:uncharacterized protein (DUF58 family)